MKIRYKINGKPVKFVRYGGLSPKKQEGYKMHKKEPENVGFHTPPAKRGFYAFVWPYIDLFLVSGGGEKDSKFPSKHITVKDSKGNPIYYPDDIDENGKPVSEHVIPKQKLIPRKTFDYYGDIWHHLEVPKYKIKHEVGSWVKTDFPTYIEALRREIHSGLSNDVLGDWMGSKGDINYEYQPNWKRTGSPFSNICRDHLEVFIQDIH